MPQPHTVPSDLTAKVSHSPVAMPTTPARSLACTGTSEPQFPSHPLPSPNSPKSFRPKLQTVPSRFSAATEFWSTETDTMSESPSTRVGGFRVLGSPNRPQPQTEPSPRMAKLLSWPAMTDLTPERPSTWTGV